MYSVHHTLRIIHNTFQGLLTTHSQLQSVSWSLPVLVFFQQAVPPMWRLSQPCPVLPCPVCLAWSCPVLFCSILSCPLLFSFHYTHHHHQQQQQYRISSSIKGARDGKNHLNNRVRDRNTSLSGSHSLSLSFSHSRNHNSSSRLIDCCRDQAGLSALYSIQYSIFRLANLFISTHYSCIDLPIHLYTHYILLFLLSIHVTPVSIIALLLSVFCTIIIHTTHLSPFPLSPQPGERGDCGSCVEGSPGGIWRQYHSRTTRPRGVPSLTHCYPSWGELVCDCVLSSIVYVH